jgi:hypothetical protein
MTRPAAKQYSGVANPIGTLSFVASVPMNFTRHQHRNRSDTANRFVRHSFRLLTHDWDSQS